jgi:hypothetical protein
MLGFCTQSTATLRFFMREPGHGRTGMSLPNRAYACRHAGVTAVQHLCQQAETESFLCGQSGWVKENQYSLVLAKNSSAPVKQGRREYLAEAKLLPGQEIDRAAH